MALADFFNPQPQPSQGSSTVDGWRNWVQSPQGRAALIQFGATLSQPMGIGQNTLGHVGRAVAGGFEARDRTTAAQMEAERLEQERQDRLARQQQQQSQFEAQHGLSQQRLGLEREELGLRRPLIEAQTARQMRLATQPPGATGAAWGPASRQLQTLVNAYSREDDLMGDKPPFEEYVQSFGFDAEQLRMEAEAERAAYQQRFGAQTQPQPQAAPLENWQGSVTGTAQAAGAGGQPQISPKPTKEVVSDPAGQDVLQGIVDGLMSNDAAVKAAAQQKLMRLRLYVTDPDELDRFFERALQQRMRSNRAAPAR